MLKKIKYLVIVYICLIEFNKKGIMLDPSKNLAIQGQHDSNTGEFLTAEEIIALHHYYMQ